MPLLGRTLSLAALVFASGTPVMAQPLAVIGGVPMALIAASPRSRYEASQRFDQPAGEGALILGLGAVGAAWLLWSSAGSARR